jgi:dihydrodipicolinate reductase
VCERQVCKRPTTDPSKTGELLTVRHTGTEYGSFVDGALLAIRHVSSTHGVTVGLDAAIAAGAG